jgi:hypothetical protein
MITNNVAAAQAMANANAFSPLLLDQLREFSSNELRQQQLIVDMRPEFLQHFNDRDVALMYRGMLLHVITQPFLLLII